MGCRLLSVHPPRTSSPEPDPPRAARCRAAGIALIALGAARSIACAEVAPPSPYNGSGAREIEAFLSALPTWSASAAVMTSYGYDA